MNLIRALLILVAGLPCAGLAYDDDLQPPDVDIYLDVQSVHTDYDNFTGEWNGGARLRLGVELNDAPLGRAVWRLEGGYNQFGKSDFGYVRGPTPTGNPNEQVQSDVRENVRVNGFEAGLRLYDGRLLFVRGGLFMYSLKREVRQVDTLSPISGPGAPVTFALPSASGTETGVAPYLGFGIELPLTPRLGVIAEYNHYRVEGEALPNVAAGLHITF